jgi:deoxyadenosine kinase
MTNKETNETVGRIVSPTIPLKYTYGETFSPRNRIIVISGIIAAGKTTLTKTLGARLGWDMIMEPVAENPWLPTFYKEMNEVKEGKRSFPIHSAAMMQIFLLSARFNQHQKMVWSGKDCIQDRSVYEDVIFAKMLAECGAMSELDFMTYFLDFTDKTNFLHRPDLFIFLDVKPEVALSRLRIRDRGCESGVSLEYLTALRDGYEDWIKTGVDTSVPIYRADWNADSIKDGILDETVVDGIVKAIQTLPKRHMHW